MEINFSNATNLSMFNSSNSQDNVNKEQSKQLQNSLTQKKADEEKTLLEQMRKKQEETQSYSIDLLDDKANKILDALLSDKLEGEKVAVKSMLEQALATDEDMMSKERLLRKLDEFIENKKDGLNVDPYGLVNLANALKTLYEHDFAPLDIAV